MSVERFYILFLLLIPLSLSGQVAGNNVVEPVLDAQIGASANIAVSKLENEGRDFKFELPGLPDPVTGDDAEYQWESPAACTLQEVHCNVKGGTSVTINLYERARATPETGTTDMLSADLVCDTNGQTTTGFSDSALAANVPLALHIAAVSGAVDVLRVYITCRKD